MVGDSDGTTGSNVVVLRNLSTVGNLSFGSPVAVATNNTPESVAIGDFNMDGKLDLAVGSLNDQRVFIYINSSSPGSVSFGSGIKAANQTVDDPRQIVVGDFNGDGRPDYLAVADNASYMDTSYMWTFQNLFFQEDLLPPDHLVWLATM